MRPFTASLRLRLLATTVAAFASQSALAQSVPLPTGGSVRAGAATIDTTGLAVSINQTSGRAVIDWKSFSIGAGGSVNVLQPGAGSALLNRVTGNDVSHIAGTLTSNGQVFLVNRNGILIDQSGKIDAHGGFVGSTLDIDNDDFMAGKLSFAGRGAGSIVNRGTIAGGAVALLGSSVANLGTIVSPMGRVAIGAAQQATLDLNGDGFLQVAIPSDMSGADGAPLIDQSGLIDVGGGIVVMRAATARDIVRNTINMSGIVRATSVTREGGTVVLDGGEGGTVAVSGNIDASGTRGGRVDISGGDVALEGATIKATGSGVGGLVRIGGAFQGGAAGAATTAALADKFTTRFGAVGMLNAARTTTIDAASSIDASGGAAGGTVVVWSEERTRQLGTVNAAGGVGGAVELSSKGALTSYLGRVTPGTGGTLLLDPKNINVFDAFAFGGGQSADPLTGTVGYGDNSGADATFNVADIKKLMDGGTDVFLRASNDINWAANLTMSFGTSVGDLSLSAGRSVNLSGNLTLNEANLSVISNDTLDNGVIDVDRDVGAAEINAFNAYISGSIASGSSGGNIRLTMGSGAGLTFGKAGDMRLGSMTGRSITIDAGTNTVSLFDPSGAANPVVLTAAEGLSLTGAIKANAGTLTLTGRTVDWSNEASARISSTVPDTVVRFVENGVLTRYGVLNGGETGGEGGEGAPTVDATRLALGHGGAAPAYSAVYGNAYGAFDGLHLVSGSLQGSDTLGSILTGGSISTAAPAAGLGVGDYAVTTTASSGFGFASGVAGYFVDLRAANDMLRITPKALTATVTAGAYTYGSPSNVATLSGLVGNDNVGLVASVLGLGTQGLVGDSNGFAFAANMAAGQRDFTLTGLTGAAAANYTLDTTGSLSATLAIARKLLTYFGTSATSTYGTLNGAGFTLSGALAGDDVSVGVGVISRNGVTSALTARTNVGTYATKASALSGAAAGNYVIDTAASSAGSAIINPKTLFYATTDTNSTYGTLAAIAAPTLAGVVAGDAVGAAATLSNGSVALSDRTAAGNYNITAALTGAGAGNYILSSLGNSVGVLRVARLGLGVSLADTSMVYSDALASPATLTGVLSGDDVRAVGTIDNSSTNFRPDAGAHEFRLSGIAGTDVNNYFLDLPTNRTAILTVTPKPINYSINSLTTTYGTLGSVNLDLLNPSQNPLSAPIIVTNVLTGVSSAFDPNARLAVGTYRLTAGTLSGAGASNYMIATSGNQEGALVIDPKAITYSALSASSTYGNSVSNPGAVLDGAFQTDDVRANVSILSGGTAILLQDRTNAGSYVVTVGGLSGTAASNYILTGGTDGTVTIAQRLVSYRLGDTPTTYGTLATPNAIISGTLEGDSVTPLFTVNGQALSNSLNVGGYAVEIGGFGGAQGGNYALSSSASSGARIIVHAAPLTYSLAAGTSVYGDSLNLSPLLWSGMQLGDAAPTAFVTIGGAQTSMFLNAGTYTPDVESFLSPNYYLDTTNSNLGQYVVTRRPLALESVGTSAGVSYGVRPDQVTSFVRVTGFVEGTLPDGTFTASAQNLTTSTGGYVNAGTYALRTNASVGEGFSINYMIGSITEGQFKINPISLGSYFASTLRSTYGTAITLTAPDAKPLAGDVAAFSGVGLQRDGQSLTYGAQTAAGTYDIVAGSISGADARNYSGSFNSSLGALVIAPKLLSYSTGNLEGTYGILSSLGTATLSGLVGDDQVVGLNAISGGYSGARQDAGTYLFSAPTLAGAAAGNYVVLTANGAGDLASRGGFFRIAQRELTVTYNPLGQRSTFPSSWIYGTPVPDAERFFTLNGVLPGDDLSGIAYGLLTGKAEGSPLVLGSVDRLDGAINAGTYAVSAFGPTGRGEFNGADAANYVLRGGSATNAAPTFTVTPRRISGTLTVPAAITYGDAPAIGVGFSGTVANAAPDYQVTASLGATNRNLGAATALPANLAVGTQGLSVALTGLDSFNYFLGAPITGQVSITPKSVTIESLLTSVTYGLATGALFAINDMVAGDDVAPLVSLGGDTAERATTLAGGFGLPLITRDVGTYTTAIGALTGAAAGNYTLAPFVGSLAITPKSITYTSDGFAAQYGGLTLPSCATGCELSGRDNNLAYGDVTLNGVLAQDLGNLQPLTLLSLDGRSSAFNYVRNTAAGNYLQIVNGLGGSKSGNYVLDAEGSKAGLVTILPAWVEAKVSGGSRLYTNVATGKYVTLGTPGVVTVRRSTAIGEAGNAFLVGDRVNVVTGLVDAKGNLVDGTGTLQIGSYTINSLVLAGSEAANYRLIPESQGSSAGIFTVADSSIFNFTFLTTSPNGYYVPKTISSPPIAPLTTTTASTGSTTTSATAGITGGATAGATGSTGTTQTYVDGSTLTAAASGSVGLTASYTPLSATATAFVGGNVSLLINRGPVTISYSAFAEASGKVEVSLKDLTITAGGEVMAGVREAISVGGNLGSGMSGSTGLQGQAFATANGEATTSFKNGANIGTSGFIGVGASIGVNGSLSGGGVTGSLGTTLYSPGSLYIGAKFESGYADQTMTIGFNLGISLLIGGIELSPKISFSTAKIEDAGKDFANAWVGLAEMAVGVYCDAACTSARATIVAEYEAAKLSNLLMKKVDAARNLMISGTPGSEQGTRPTLAMIRYLEANPDVVHYAQELQSTGKSTPETQAITSAIANHQYLTQYLESVVSQEQALATRMANDPKSITAADVEQAMYLRSQERVIIQQAGYLFNASVGIVDGQLTFR